MAHSAERVSALLISLLYALLPLAGLAMFYFLALNSGSVFAGNDIPIYPVTGIDLGFVFRV